MASRFWVGGTGTWDASDTTHWASSSGGAGGQSVPGSSDTVTFDGSSGGGTVTLGSGYNPTLQSITCGAFTGTLTAAVNNNNVTLTASGGFNGSGSGTRTISLGNGTWTLSATNANWTMSTTTNLTFNCNSSTILFSNSTTTASRTFDGGSLTYSTVSIAASTGGGQVTLNNNNTIATLSVTGPAVVFLGSSTTQTLTTLTLTSAAATPILIQGTGTINDTAGTNAYTHLILRNVTFGGGATWSATSSFDMGGNSGITITAPAAGGAVGVIGG